MPFLHRPMRFSSCLGPICSSEEPQCRTLSLRGNLQSSCMIHSFIEFQVLLYRSPLHCQSQIRLHIFYLVLPRLFDCQDSTEVLFYIKCDLRKDGNSLSGVGLADDWGGFDEWRDVVGFYGQGFLEETESLFQVGSGKMKNSHIVFNMLCLPNLIDSLDNLDGLIN